jgi:hypothetical protein
MRARKRLSMAALGAAWVLAGLSLPAKEIPPPETGGVNPQPRPAPALTGEPSGLPALVVVPASLRIETLSDGCYVLFFDRTHFEGNRLNVVGPVELRTMTASFGARFTGLNSAVVGPRAKVIAYDDENFERRNLVLESDQQVPDFKEGPEKSKLGLFGEIKSLRVTCSS